MDGDKKAMTDETFEEIETRAEAGKALGADAGKVLRDDVLKITYKDRFALIDEVARLKAELSDARKIISDLRVEAVSRVEARERVAAAIAEARSTMAARTRRRAFSSARCRSRWANACSP